jgi:hypothetical protein
MRFQIPSEALFRRSAIVQYASYSAFFSFKVMISDLRTSIVSAMLDICLLCCAMTVFRVLISRSRASVLELPGPIAGVVGVANPAADDACFGVGTANSSSYSIVSKRDHQYLRSLFTLSNTIGSGAFSVSFGASQSSLAGATASSFVTVEEAGLTAELLSAGF